MLHQKSLLWGAIALALTVTDVEAATTAAAKPAQPTSLFAKGMATDTALVTWSDNATNESEYHLEVRSSSTASFLDLGPIPRNATSIKVFNLKPQTTYYFRARAKNAAGWSAYSNEAAGTTFYTTPPSCDTGDGTMCLAGRYRVQATYERIGSATIRGNGHASELSSETGIFWFFDPSNVEAIVKVLDGCSLNDRRWIYTTGLTDLRVLVTVVDTQTGATATYLNPGGGPFTPVNDTDALPCD